MNRPPLPLTTAPRGGEPLQYRAEHIILPRADEERRTVTYYRTRSSSLPRTMSSSSSAPSPDRVLPVVTPQDPLTEKCHALEMQLKRSQSALRAAEQQWAQASQQRDEYRRVIHSMQNYIERLHVEIESVKTTSSEHDGGGWGAASSTSTSWQQQQQQQQQPAAHNSRSSSLADYAQNALSDSATVATLQQRCADLGKRLLETLRVSQRREKELAQSWAAKRRDEQRAIVDVLREVDAALHQGGLLRFLDNTAVGGGGCSMHNGESNTNIDDALVLAYRLSTKVHAAAAQKKLDQVDVLRSVDSTRGSLEAVRQSVSDAARILFQALRVCSSTSSPFINGLSHGGEKEFQHGGEATSKPNARFHQPSLDSSFQNTMMNTSSHSSAAPSPHHRVVDIRQYVTIEGTPSPKPKVPPPSPPHPVAAQPTERDVIERLRERIAAQTNATSLPRALPMRGAAASTSSSAGGSTVFDVHYVAALHERRLNSDTDDGDLGNRIRTANSVTSSGAAPASHDRPPTPKTRPSSLTALREGGGTTTSSLPEHGVGGMFVLNEAHVACDILREAYHGLDVVLDALDSIGRTSATASPKQDDDDFSREEKKDCTTTLDSVLAGFQKDLKTISELSLRQGRHLVVSYQTVPPPSRSTGSSGLPSQGGMHSINPALSKKGVPHRIEPKVNYPSTRGEPISQTTASLHTSQLDIHEIDSDEEAEDNEMVMIHSNTTNHHGISTTHRHMPPSLLDDPDESGFRNRRTSSSCLFAPDQSPPRADVTISDRVHEEQQGWNDRPPSSTNTSVISERRRVVVSPAF